MPWARLSDAFYSHPKVQDTLDDPSGLGWAAVGLWVVALSRSYQPNVNRPQVYHREVNRLNPTLGQALAAILVANDLWESSGDGFVIHDWDVYRAPWDDPEVRRLGGLARAATAQREGGRFVSGKPGGQPVGRSPAIHQRSTSRVTSKPTSRPPAAPAAAGEREPRTNGADPSTSRYQHPLDQQHQHEPEPEYEPEKVPVREPKGSREWIVSAPMAFQTAWHVRFMQPPTNAQQRALAEAVTDWPGLATGTVADAARHPDAKAADVIAAVLEAFHTARANAQAQAAIAEVEADARRRAEARPRSSSAPSRIAPDDLPM